MDYFEDFGSIGVGTIMIGLVSSLSFGVSFWKVLPNNMTASKNTYSKSIETASPVTSYKHNKTNTDALTEKREVVYREKTVSPKTEMVKPAENSDSTGFKPA